MFCLSVCHYVCLSVCQSVCLSVCVSVCLSVCLSVCQSVGWSVDQVVGRSVGTGSSIEALKDPLEYSAKKIRALIYVYASCFYYTIRLFALDFHRGIVDSSAALVNIVE